MGNKPDFKEENILTVAKWWADQLREQAPSASVANTGDAQLAVADRIRLRLKPSEEKIAAFELKLADLLRNLVCPTNSTYLMVDYHAQGLLLEACNSAGIDDMSFPWKTTMLVGYDHAQVRADSNKPFYVYGGPVVQEVAP